MDAPPLGILLDVDGPVSSPDTRTVAPPLLDDLRALLAKGVPVVLNTGRSAAFVAEKILGPLSDAGLPPAARLHAVCEKGGVWTSAGPDGVGGTRLDPALRVPDVCRDLLEALVRDAYGDAMFVDRTKQVMATVEARTDVPNGHYLERQAAFDAELVPLGSAGYKTVAVARGEVDAYVHSGGQYQWDSAAPVAIARAAGLVTCRLDGSPLVYNDPDPWLPDLLVCRPGLAPAILEAIAATVPDQETEVTSR